jgi:hypothetical protein
VGYRSFPTTQAEEAEGAWSSCHRDDTERDACRWDRGEGAIDATSQLATQPNTQYTTQPHGTQDGAEIEQLPIDDDGAYYPNCGGSILDNAVNDDDNDDTAIAVDGSNATETSRVVEKSHSPYEVRHAFAIADERTTTRMEMIVGTMHHHPRDDGARIEVVDDESGWSRVVEDAGGIMNATHGNATAAEYDSLTMIDRQHSFLADVIPLATMRNAGVDGKDVEDDDGIVDPPLQFDTAGIDVMDNDHGNDNGDRSTIATPHHRAHVVMNPYAKRPFDRISRDSCSGALDGEAHNNVVAVDSASGALPRNQVSNPYHKSSQITKKRTPRSYSRPKAKVTDPDMIHIPADDAKNLEHDSQPSASSANGKLPPFWRAGIGMSLPMVERLPSRNVSYRPAEILTVGELYRYLYNHTNFTKKHHQPGTQQDVVESEAEVRASNCAGSARVLPEELTSVRITGTLLCVANSNPDEKDGKICGSLYSSGTYFLVGDPLDNMRFLNEKSQTVQQVEQGTADYNTDDATNAKLKLGLTSILRNKGAPISLPPADISNVQGATTAGNENENASTAVFSATKQVNQHRETVDSDTVTSKTMSRGFMNTNKKKRLVFSGGGSRLSFGGLAGRGGGNLGGRKFTTPKRVNSPVLVSSVTDLPSVAYIHSTKHPKLEQIIQFHPSPIVPVWIGSPYDDDGLDGSIIGDLVMIMGEIITEYCEDCRERNSKRDGADVVFNDEHMRTSLGSEIQHRDAEDTTTPLRGVHDAARLIAITALKVSGGCACRRFLKARFVKNANGTDMSLQRESLRVRRAYLAERKCHVTNEGLYSVGLGPPG